MMNKIECLKCSHAVVKNGKSRNGTQRYYCKVCKKYCQSSYRYRACAKDTNNKIATLLKESCGVRSIARILKISAATVLKRILSMGNSTMRPSVIVKGKEYEVDEMLTYIGNKKQLYWIVYALRKDTREVIDFKVGKRTLKTLQRVTDTLLMSEAKMIYTDGYKFYKHIIPKEIHRISKYNINHIERFNLNLRTHLKRLGRKTICFSRSKAMLEACLKIYFWHSAHLFELATLLKPDEPSASQ